LQEIGLGKPKFLISAIDRKINSPLTSSAGRLFDAVAAIIDLVTVSSFEAEAPIRLESILRNTDECYCYSIKEQVSTLPLIQEIVRDVKLNTPKSLISGKFHNTMVAIIVELAERMRMDLKLSTVVLSGGVFQNRYLLEKSEERLRGGNFRVYSNTTVPVNDGGICLGQLAIAAKIRELGDVE